ncbi:MAG TPA: hypothetical protein VMY43_07035 [Methanothrix sp.]|nr:hypothetical protein [Methanothrix sp.]
MSRKERHVVPNQIESLMQRGHLSIAIGKLKRLTAQETYAGIKALNAWSTAVMEKSRVQIAMENIPTHQRIRNNFGWLFCTYCKSFQLEPGRNNADILISRIGK